jgi:putative oxidoreductase
MTIKSLLSPSSRPDAGLAILRIVLGIVFAAHGAQKIWSYGLDGVIQGFAQSGIPMAAVAGPLVAGVEFAGGIALVLGLFSRLAASGLAAVMLGAMLFVHARNGFFLPMGVEFTLTLLAAVLAIVIAGPGSFSVDAAIVSRFGKRV